MESNAKKDEHYCPEERRFPAISLERKAGNMTLSNKRFFSRISRVSFHTGLLTKADWYG